MEMLPTLKKRMCCVFCSCFNACCVTVTVDPGCTRCVFVFGNGCRVGFCVRDSERTSLDCCRRVWSDSCVSALEHWQPASVHSAPVLAAPNTQKTTEIVYVNMYMWCIMYIYIRVSVPEQMNYSAVLCAVCEVNVRHSVEVWGVCHVGSPCLDPSAADLKRQTLPV